MEKEIPQKITDKYIIQNNAFIKTIKNDIENKIEFQVGDKVKTEFEPELKITRWNDGINLIVKPIGLEKIVESDKNLIFEGEKLKFTTPKVDYALYSLGEKEVKGGGQINTSKEYSYEQEIILKEKLKSNIIEFTAEINGLEFRSKNNGYEFFRKFFVPDIFSKEKGVLREIEDSAFYLNPIKAKDANGKELKIVSALSNGSLKIVIDSIDFESAVYPISIDPSYTVKSGIICDNSTGINSGRKLARTSNGDLHCVWMDKRNNDYTQIYYAKSIDNGEIWTETALTSGSYNQEYPCIAVDGNNYIHVAWRGTHSGSITYNQIRYIKYTTSWQAIENLTSENYHQNDVTIAVDGNNYIHITWGGTYSGSTSYSQVRYIKYTTSWQTIENLTSGNYNQDYPCIAVDSNNYIHIAWMGTHSGSTTYIQERYIKYTTSWQAIENLTSDSFDQYCPSIAIDDNNYIHIAWMGKYTGYSTYWQLRYRKYTTSWQAIENLTNDSSYAYEWPSITTDSNNYIHISWLGKHSGSTTYNQIRYIKYTTSWQAIENLTSASDNQHFSRFIGTLHPTIGGIKTNRVKNGYAFVWCDQTSTNSTKFYKSSDLAWDGAVSTNPAFLLNFV